MARPGVRSWPSAPVPGLWLPGWIGPLLMAGSLVVPWVDAPLVGSQSYMGIISQMLHWTGTIIRGAGNNATGALLFGVWLLVPGLLTLVALLSAFSGQAPRNLCGWLGLGWAVLTWGAVQAFQASDWLAGIGSAALTQGYLWFGAAALVCGALRPPVLPAAAPENISARA